MALVASRSEIALVRVVVNVACVAHGGLRNFCDVLFFVAEMAVQPLMRSGERILGLLGVIKPPEFPAVRIVASRAIRAKAAFVSRILVAV